MKSTMALYLQKKQFMRQYTPMGNLPAPFDRRVTDEEYDAVLSWMYLNELEGFTQEAEAADTGFIPDF